MRDSIGKIGQKYENRKSKKVGVLVSDDGDLKVLTFQDETGEEFSVTYASFRSNWRKVIDEVNEEKSTVDYTEHNNGLIDSFVKEVGSVRDISFMQPITSSDSNSLIVDGIEVAKFVNENGHISGKVVADLYSFTDLANHVVPGTLKFTLGEILDVSFVSDFSCVGEFLYTIKDSVIDLNLHEYLDK